MCIGTIRRRCSNALRTPSQVSPATTTSINARHDSDRLDRKDIDDEDQKRSVPSCVISITVTFPESGPQHGLGIAELARIVREEPAVSEPRRGELRSIGVAKVGQAKDLRQNQRRRRIALKCARSNAVMAMSAFSVISSIGIKENATPIAAAGSPFSAAAKLHRRGARRSFRASPAGGGARLRRTVRRQRPPPRQRGAILSLEWPWARQRLPQSGVINTCAPGAARAIMLELALRDFRCVTPGRIALHFSLFVHVVSISRDGSRALITSVENCSAAGRAAR